MLIMEVIYPLSVCMNFFLLPSFFPPTLVFLLFVCFVCMLSAYFKCPVILNCLFLFKSKTSEVIWRQVFSVLGFTAGWPGWAI